MYYLWGRNKYIFRSHISKKKLREIIRLFIVDIEASKIAIIIDITHETINRILLSLRRRLSKISEQACFYGAGIMNWMNVTLESAECEGNEVAKL